MRMPERDASMKERPRFVLWSTNSMFDREDNAKNPEPKSKKVDMKVGDVIVEAKKHLDTLFGLVPKVFKSTASREKKGCLARINELRGYTVEEIRDTDNYIESMEIKWGDASKSRRRASYTSDLQSPLGKRRMEKKILGGIEDDTAEKTNLETLADEWAKNTMKQQGPAMEKIPDYDKCGEASTDDKAGDSVENDDDSNHRSDSLAVREEEYIETMEHLETLVPELSNAKDLGDTSKERGLLGKFNEEENQELGNSRNNLHRARVEAFEGGEAIQGMRMDVDGEMIEDGSEHEGADAFDGYNKSRTPSEENDEEIGIEGKEGVAVNEAIVINPEQQSEQGQRFKADIDGESTEQSNVLDRAGGKASESDEDSDIEVLEPLDIQPLSWLPSQSGDTIESRNHYTLFLSKNEEIYCGAEGVADEVKLSRKDILDLIEGRDISETVITLCINIIQTDVEASKGRSAKFAVLNIHPSVYILKHFAARIEQGYSTLSTDFHTHRSLFEDLWKVFHIPHLIIPIHHQSIDHYSILEVVHRSDRIKLHIPVLENDTYMNRVVTEAHHMAYQVRVFMGIVHNDVLYRTDEDEGKRTEVYDEIEGEHQVDKVKMSLDEEKTCNFIVSKGLKETSYNVQVMNGCPKMKKNVNDSGLYVLHMIDSLIQGKRYSATGAKQWRVLVLNKLINFWMEE